MSAEKWTTRTFGLPAAEAGEEAKAKAARAATSARNPRKSALFTTVKILSAAGSPPLRPKAGSATVERGSGLKRVCAAVLVVLAFPGVARAGDAALAVREVPLHGERAPAAAASPRFDLVGLHWRGPGSVSFSTRSLAGRWSAWRAAAPEAEDAPDVLSAEATREASWRLGSPYWTGLSDGIRYRLRGAVSQLRAYFVRSTAVAVP